MLPNNEQIENLKNETFISSLLLISAYITPGVTYLYVFDHDFFLSLSFSKILLFAVVVMSPLVLFNFVVAYEMLNAIKKDNDDDKVAQKKYQTYTAFVISVAFSVFVLYVTLFHAYTTGNGIFDISRAFILALAVEAGFLLSLLLSIRKEKLERLQSGEKE